MLNLFSKTTDSVYTCIKCGNKESLSPWSNLKKLHIRELIECLPSTVITFVFRLCSSLVNFLLCCWNPCVRKSGEFSFFNCRYNKNFGSSTKFSLSIHQVKVLVYCIMNSLFAKNVSLIEFEFGHNLQFGNISGEFTIDSVWDH